MKRLLLLLCTSYLSFSKPIIYIIPSRYEYFGDKLFSIPKPQGRARSQENNYYYRMRNLKRLLEKEGYAVKTPTLAQKDPSRWAGIKPDKNIKYIIDLTRNSTFTLKNLDRHANKCIIFLWEPPSVRSHLYDLSFHNKVAKVFTWIDSLIDNKKYFRFVYPSYRGIESQDFVPFKEKRLCVLINGNKNSTHKDQLYSARRNVIDFFERKPNNQFDFYGRGWKRRYKNYKGSLAVDKKWDCLKGYRFCICYENMKNIQGYISEKIFDCFEVGCVPVYWGASNITDYIPKNCFIDRRDFKNNNELYKYLKNMKEKEYNQYLYNINAYMRSDKPKIFTYDTLIETLLCALTGD